jgi:uncharacterized protein (TIGR00255 family)
MTGYGRGECARDGFKVTVEVSSVNRKQSEVAVNLPRELDVLEAQIRDEVHKAISRGRLTVRVALHYGGQNAASQVRVNLPLARAYARVFQKLARGLRLAEPVLLDLLVRAPGVLHGAGEISEAEQFWPAVRKALQTALAALVRMREREGAHLARDLAARMQALRRSCERVTRRAPQAQVHYRRQLLQRIRSAGLEVPPLDDERLTKEVVYFADRSDITEELTRLQSHFQQFEDCLGSQEPVGRTLDFLAQEMNREVNTLGSKANDSLISREVVTLKAELERFREQAQNVE